jgi:hypothetical protein
MCFRRDGSILEPTMMPIDHGNHVEEVGFPDSTKWSDAELRQ